MMRDCNGSEGEAITLEEAAAYTANYRNQSSASAETARTHCFCREIKEIILEQEGSVVNRMYYDLNEKGVKQLVLIGVGTDGQDMEAGVVADKSGFCLPNCSTSILNG